MRVEVVERSVVRFDGLESGHPLIFLHAFGDSSHCYKDVISNQLLARYRLIALDLWGFGASPSRPEIQTVQDYSAALERLIRKICPDQAIGLIGHSIAGSMAVEIATGLGPNARGVFSIEGNLTPDDAMFTGKAADFEDPAAFKEKFLNDIWEMGQTSDELRHYYSGACIADPSAMWHLGRDAKRISANNALGKAFQRLTQPKIYYWSKVSTPLKTAKWIEQTGIPNELYTSAAHWPMVSQPEATARSISEFFGTCFS